MPWAPLVQKPRGSSEMPGRGSTSLDSIICRIGDSEDASLSLLAVLRECKLAFGYEGVAVCGVLGSVGVAGVLLPQSEKPKLEASESVWIGAVAGSVCLEKGYPNLLTVSACLKDSISA